MTSYQEETSYPAICHQAGLDCESCVQASAGELARACQGLRAKLVVQLFVQIHPHDACAKMHRQFTAAYRDAQRTDRLMALAAAV